MARWAIGDVQGCADELAALIERIGFRPDCDRLWFVGDLVNRGPGSLEVLRRVRALGDNAVCVLGNHDLHLLAVAHGHTRQRRGDTIQTVLEAPDRGPLLEWLGQCPLAHFAPESGDLMVHAGLVPQWSPATALALAGDAQRVLRADPDRLLAAMYGDQPDRWREDLESPGRLRFTVNVLTRLRFCTPDGRIDLKCKGRPDSVPAPWLPWFRAPHRASVDTRVIFGHWSALGWYRADGVIGLDTGCVWGGALTALDLDAERAQPVSVPSRRPRSIGV